MDAIILALAVVVLVIIDYLYALSVTVPSAFAGTALLFALLLAARPRQSRTRRISIAAVVVAVAVVIRLINWTPVKPFLKDLHSIRPGMTEADVNRVMGKYTEGTGWPGSIDGDGSRELRVPNTIVFRPTSAPGDSNWGMVQFQDGRVVQVEFSPD
jgi:hypothetical protein